MKKIQKITIVSLLTLFCLLAIPSALAGIIGWPPGGGSSDPPSAPYLYKINGQDPATDDDGIINLDWYPSSGASSYKVFRRIKGYSWSSTPIATVTYSDYTDFAPPSTENKDYEYSVKAHNSDGDSPRSNDREVKILCPDWDDDGMLNVEEEMGWYCPQLESQVYPYLPGSTTSNPWHPNPPPLDTDGDGLDDLTERAIKTNPRDPDTDGDGVDDAKNDYDFDGDGLIGSHEIYHFGTDPDLADTDGDSFSDWEEIVQYHSNPNDPLDPFGDHFEDEALYTIPSDWSVDPWSDYNYQYRLEHGPTPMSGKMFNIWLEDAGLDARQVSFYKEVDFEPDSDDILLVNFDLLFTEFKSDFSLALTPGYYFNSFDHDDISDARQPYLEFFATNPSWGAETISLKEHFWFGGPMQWDIFEESKDFSFLIGVLYRIQIVINYDEQIISVHINGNQELFMDCETREANDWEWLHPSKDIWTDDIDFITFSPCNYDLNDDMELFIDNVKIDYGEKMDTPVMSSQRIPVILHRLYAPPSPGFAKLSITETSITTREWSISLGAEIGDYEFEGGYTYTDTDTTEYYQPYQVDFGDDDMVIGFFVDCSLDVSGVGYIGQTTPLVVQYDFIMIDKTPFHWTVTEYELNYGPIFDIRDYTSYRSVIWAEDVGKDLSLGEPDDPFYVSDLDSTSDMWYGKGSISADIGPVGVTLTVGYKSIHSVQTKHTYYVYCENPYDAHKMIRLYRYNFGDCMQNYPCEIVWSDN